MKALAELVEVLKEDEEVKAFQRLEDVLLADETLLKSYQTMLAQQKRLVNHEVKRAETLPDTREAYEHQLANLTDNPFIENYLTHQESINTMLQWIHATIEASLETTINDTLKTLK